jgi:hypothetical protein
VWRSWLRWGVMCGAYSTIGLMAEAVEAGVVKVVREAGQVVVSGPQGEVCRYVEEASAMELPEGMAEVYAGSGFLRSLRTPGGVELLDVLAVGHPHHRGVFSAWAKVRVGEETVDVWNVQKETGRTEAVGLAELEESGFSALRRHVKVGGEVLLEERWRVGVAPGDGFNAIDIDMEQVVRAPGGVILETYAYGGLGFRATRYWNAADEKHFIGAPSILTSEGETDREAANHRRARWILLEGPFPEGKAGVVMLQHPQTDRFPQPVRLHPTMPYFVFCPVVNEPLSLPEGAFYRARFRILAFDERPSVSRIEAEWERFAGRP